MAEETKIQTFEQETRELELAVDRLLGRPYAIINCPRCGSLRLGWLLISVSCLDCGWQEDREACRIVQRYTIDGSEFPRMIDYLVRNFDRVNILADKLTYDADLIQSGKVHVQVGIMPSVHVYDHLGMALCKAMVLANQALGPNQNVPRDL
jgi:hypothetical protein